MEPLQPQNNNDQTQPVQNPSDNQAWSNNVTSQPVVQTSTTNPVENLQEPHPQPFSNSYNLPPNMGTPATPHGPNNPGTIILQWLTYALWGWTVLAMSFLTATVLASFLEDSDVNSGAPYAIAAVLVLLPMSVVCDFFYSKKEPVKKTGVASIVMVIHAVIFALIAVGSLIAAVFSVVSMFTSSSESTATKIALYSALIITVLYVAVLLRTIHPAKFPWIRRFFIIFMVVVVGIISILGIVGPVADARVTRNDKLIEENISSVSRAVNAYTNKNQRLPGDLNGIELSGDAKKLVSDKLVTYEPNTKPRTVSTDDHYSSENLNIAKPNTDYTYYYQLCVDYKKSNKDKYGDPYDYLGKDEYSSEVLAYSHDAGKTCYKVKTSPYDY